MMVINAAPLFRAHDSGALLHLSRALLPFSEPSSQFQARTIVAVHFCSTTVHAQPLLSVTWEGKQSDGR